MINFLISNIKNYLSVFFKLLNSNSIFCNGDIDIAFFSEGISHRKYYYNFILELIKFNEAKIYYFTSEREDLKFDFNNLNFKTIYIGKGLLREIFFLRINCKFFLTTTTDLGTKKFKKSKNKINYVYLPHSAGSTHLTFPADAFDNFEIIFLVNKFQKKEIEKREEEYKLRKKIKVEFGYPIIDNLIEKEKEIGSINLDKVLFAPTWGNNFSLCKIGYELIDLLVKNKKKIIFRPHPQSFYNKNEKKHIIAILKNFSNNKFFYFDKSGTIENLIESKLLITDWSGISIEYGLSLNRPIIFLDNKNIKKINQKYENLNIEPIEFKIRNILGITLNYNLSNIVEIINDLTKLKNYNEIDKHRHLLDEYLYNVHRSAKEGANYIQKNL